MPQYIPDGWRSVTPRLVAKDPAGLVEFLQTTFDALGDYSPEAPAVMRIADSIIMVGGVGPRQEMPAFLYVYVQDVDVTYRRALKAGAISLEQPTDMAYGDRRAMVKDPWGNHWQIATYQGGR